MIVGIVIGSDRSGLGVSGRKSVCVLLAGCWMNNLALGLGLLRAWFGAPWVIGASAVEDIISKPELGVTVFSLNDLTIPWPRSLFLSLNIPGLFSPRQTQN
jgi:hypothetical protein